MKPLRRTRLVVAAGVAVALTAVSSRADFPRVTYAVSGGDGGGPSWNPSISGGGRLVAFQSDGYDTNSVTDVFLHDRDTGALTVVSVSSDEAAGDGSSYNPAISSDGRFVSFESLASNLVAGDFNQAPDVFVRDLAAATTERVSVGSAGTEATGDSEVFGRQPPAISGDGRYVAFESEADNLVAGDTNGYSDIFVRDRWVGTTIRASVSSAGVEATQGSFSPAISTVGAHVAFDSLADNLVAGDTNTTCVEPLGGQTFNCPDVFVHDMETGATVRASVSTLREQGNEASGRPALSGKGRFVVFESLASNLAPGDGAAADLYLRDLDAGVTSLVSSSSLGQAGNLASLDPSLSVDGRFVAFSSDATNLVDGDTNGRRDVFVRDTRSGLTTRVSVSYRGEQAMSDFFEGSFRPAIASDGRYVAFDSDARNLIADDTDGFRDVFVRDRATCNSGEIEDGPVSGRVHEAEPGIGPAGPVAHGALCDVAAPLEL